MNLLYYTSSQVTRCCHVLNIGHIGQKIKNLIHCPECLNFANFKFSKSDNRIIYNAHHVKQIYTHAPALTIIIVVLRNIKYFPNLEVLKCIKYSHALSYSKKLKIVLNLCLRSIYKHKHLKYTDFKKFIKRLIYIL